MKGAGKGKEAGKGTKWWEGAENGRWEGIGGKRRELEESGVLYRIDGSTRNGMRLRN